MKVLLVNPSLSHQAKHRTYATFPNGLLFLAAVLEQHGHSVAVYDRNVDHREPEDFLAFGPQIVGVSVVTSPEIDDAIELSKKFKRLIPEAGVVWGGVHPSVLPEQTLSEPYIDYLVIGEGEHTLLDLVHSLEKGDGRLSEINGLAYKAHGTVCINKPRPFIKDLDQLPDPAWHLVDVSKYWDVTLNTSRGCPFRCTFCYNTVFHSGHWGEFSAERIVSQIVHLKKSYNVKYVKVWEDNFTYDRKRLRLFCKLVIEKNLKVRWDCETRAGLKEEDIALMAKAGCISAGIGAETGSPRLLEFMCKDTTVDEVEKTVWLLVKYKILPRLYIMHGVPTETTDDFWMTQELLERLDNPPYQYMRFIPYPETPLFKYCIENELITSPHELGDWAAYTTRMANGTNLSQVPKQLIDGAMRHFIQTYATRSLRFTIKHNPASLLASMGSPKGLIKALRGLFKAYLSRRDYSLKGMRTDKSWPLSSYSSDNGQRTTTESAASKTALVE